MKTKKTKAAAKKTPKAMFPRAASNPFRPGSAYAAGYDVLSAHPQGLPRQRLVELMAKATRKSEKRANFDAAVVLSAQTSPTGPRHRSCREGFWVERTNDHLKLRTT